MTLIILLAILLFEEPIIQAEGLVFQLLATPQQCVPTQLDISGTPPYDLEIVTIDAPSRFPPQKFNIQSSQEVFTWETNVPAGSEVEFRLTDDFGDTSTLSSTIESSNDDSCLSDAASSLASSTTQRSTSIPPSTPPSSAFSTKTTVTTSASSSAPSPSHSDTVSPSSSADTTPSGTNTASVLSSSIGSSNSGSGAQASLRPGSNGTDSTTPQTGTAGRSERSLSPGAIAGISVAAILSLFMTFFLLLSYIRKRRRDEGAPSTHRSVLSESSAPSVHQEVILIETNSHIAYAAPSVANLVTPYQMQRTEPISNNTFANEKYTSPQDTNPISVEAQAPPSPNSPPRPILTSERLSLHIDTLSQEGMEHMVVYEVDGGVCIEGGPPDAVSLSTGFPRGRRAILLPPPYERY